MANLERFVAAQAPVVDDVLAEIRSEQKRTHWMWFVFPQLRDLGRSSIAKHYGIASLDEARAYLNHRQLGDNLLACTRAVLATSARSAEQIFGSTDAMKLRSSMTLFHAADPGEPAFRAVLDRFFDGQPDLATLAILDGER